MSNILRLHEAADKLLESEARELLAEKLRSGESVGGLTFFDLLDSELGSMERYSIAIQKVHEILRSEYPDASLFIERFNNGLIERWLDQKQEIVDETMHDIETGRAEDAAYQNYRAREEA